MSDYRIAQFNIAKMVAPLDDPRMREFAEALEPINTLADSSPGFVWRLQDDSGDATSIQAFDNPFMLANLSVWESVASLRDFTYHTEHLRFLKDKRQWFEPMEPPHLVLWWIEAGHTPKLPEARQKLDLLGRHGPTADAFTLARHFDPPADA